MRLVGYLLNTSGGPEGEPGFFYDYVLAGNGLFVRASGHLLEATVRGLVPLEEAVELPQGRIPRTLYHLALSVLGADP